MANLSTDNFQLAVNTKQEEHDLRVLIVEENPLQQTVLVHLLKQLGHTVSVASDGFDAISAIQRDGRFDVILIDCQMSLMDGFQATRFIRQMERATGQKTAIIGISSSALPAQCFEAGMDDFLSKPLNKPILKAILGHWIRQKKGVGDRR